MNRIKPIDNTTQSLKVKSTTWLSTIFAKICDMFVKNAENLNKNNEISSTIHKSLNLDNSL